MNRLKLLFIVMMISFSALAQNLLTDTLFIDEVVVTTQRVPLNEQLIPYSISLLDKKEMDLFTKRSTPEMLMNTDGVFVHKTNHGGGSPFIL